MSVIEVASSPKTVQHWPASLKMFGVNPYDEAIFRVIRCESRYYLVGADHVDYNGDPSPDRITKKLGKDPNVSGRTREYRWIPLYPGLHGWILEKWCSPISFTGCSPEQWKERYTDHDSGLLILGPYPDRGEYERCFVFPGEPTSSLISDQIYKIRAGWNYTFNDHRAANQAFLDKREKAVGDRRIDIMKDSQQAFKNKPSNVRPGKRTPDKITFRHTAPMKKRGFYTYARND